MNKQTDILGLHYGRDGVEQVTDPKRAAQLRKPAHVDRGVLFVAAPVDFVSGLAKRTPRSTWAAAMFAGPFTPGAITSGAASLRSLAWSKTACAVQASPCAATYSAARMV